MKPYVSRKTALIAVLALCCLALGSPTALAGQPDRGVVNLNNASLAQLQMLPGIGLAKAKAIVEHRDRQPFASVDDLLKVKGIGKSLVEKVRHRAVVKGPTTAKAPVKKKGKKRGK